MRAVGYALGTALWALMITSGLWMVHGQAVASWHHGVDPQDGVTYTGGLLILTGLALGVRQAVVLARDSRKDRRP